MNVFEMVVLIVAISAIAAVMKSYFKRKNEAEQDSYMDNFGTNMDVYLKREITPFLMKINKLEERVQILERIVTDKNHNLAAEIDNLK